ncbi:MAG: LysR family transcriptional regulator [Pseudomonadota bacterium]|jgi:DNA-binding transcriptional LysR family regulator
MNTRDLEAFLAVVETGSIVAAAARLHLTQSGVSRRIQSLEEQLGVALLDRLSKPLKPTAAGHDTYAHGRRVLRVLDDLKSELSRDGAVTGEFRLGITPYLSEIALTAPLDQLRGSFPDLTLCVTTGWPEQLVERLRRGEIDAAAFCLPEAVDPPDDLVTDVLDLQPLVVVVPQACALRSSTTLQALAAYPWIINPDGCGFRSALRRRLAQDDLPLRVGVEALSSDLRLSLVARGAGITLATRAAIEASPLRSQLRIVTVRDFAPKVRAFLVHRPPAGRLAPPIAALATALKAALAAPEPARRRVAAR